MIAYDATIDSFVGQIVQDGKPVAFEPGEKVILQLVFHDRGGAVRNPGSAGRVVRDRVDAGRGLHGGARTDGRVQRGAAGERPPSTYPVPGGLIISDQKSKYEVELGKDWKP